MRKNKFLAVIHVADPMQALRNAIVAVDNGVDGVFLINHKVLPSVLLDAYVTVRMGFPDLWVGLNFLGISGVDAWRLVPTEAQGLWLDNAGIQPYGAAAGFIFTEAARIRMERERQPQRRHIEYFGGVAFKYQPPVIDHVGVAQFAADFVDVITTSGEETGSPPTLEKILAMREGAGEKPLAVASGMTPENVEPFLDHVDYFLVATGVSKSHLELDGPIVRLFADKMRR